MSPPRIAKPFRRRLPPYLTPADLRRMAWLPSVHAPRAQDLQYPPPFVPPGPPPMGEPERSLHEAVLAAPDADEPRLRYADWFDQQGDERGEFIRLQIALLAPSPLMGEGGDGGDAGQGAAAPHLNPPPSGGRGPEAAARCQSLLALHAPRWLAPLAPWAAKDVDFRRGFPDALSVSGRAFLALGGGLFRTAPVQSVRLVAVQPYTDELPGCPHLAKLARLDLSGNRIGPPGVRHLAGATVGGHFRSLDLSRNDLGPAGVRELLAAPWAGQLRDLSLADNGLDIASVAALLAGCTRLTALDLSDNPLGPALADVLAASPLAHRLTTIRLAGCRVGPVRFDSFDALRELDLRFNNLGPAGVAVPPGLDALDLGFNDLGDAGTEALAASANLHTVTRLGLRANRIGPAGATALAASPFLGRVASLDLMSNRLGDSGAVALLSRGFASLETLDLGNNGLTDSAIPALTSLPRLESLSLAWNPISPPAAAMLRSRFGTTAA